MNLGPAISAGIYLGVCLMDRLISSHDSQTAVSTYNPEAKKNPPKKKKKEEEKQTPLTGPQVKNILSVQKSILTQTKEGQMLLVIGLVSMYTVKVVNAKGRHTLAPIHKLYAIHDSKVLGG